MTERIHTLLVAEDIQEVVVVVDMEEAMEVVEAMVVVEDTVVDEDDDTEDMISARRWGAQFEHRS